MSNPEGDPQTGLPIDIPMERLVAFCQRWHVRELALFGSVLRSDFRPDSDIDVLITFESGARQSLNDRPLMHQELETLFGRRVDVVYRRVIERDSNYLLRRSILESARTIYAA